MSVLRAWSAVDIWDAVCQVLRRQGDRPWHKQTQPPLKVRVASNVAWSSVLCPAEQQLA